MLAALPRRLLRRLIRRRPVPYSPRFSIEAMRAMTAAEWRTLLAGPPDQAAPRIEAAARDGVVEAMLTFAQMKLEGRGVKRDPGAAFAWFGAAAASGDPMGINMLGRCHELGWGTAPDPARAAELYAKAGGLDWALFNLGMLMLRGHGVAQDRAAATALFRRAATQGHAKAMNMLGMLAEAEDPAEAVRWFRRAAKGGDFRGQFNLATVLVQLGEITEAVGWFRAALASGNPDIVAGVRRLLAGHESPELRALASDCLRPQAPAGANSGKIRPASGSVKEVSPVRQ